MCLSRPPKHDFTCRTALATPNKFCQLNMITFICTWRTFFSDTLQMPIERQVLRLCCHRWSWKMANFVSKFMENRHPLLKNPSVNYTVCPKKYTEKVAGHRNERELAAFFFSCGLIATQKTNPLQLFLFRLITSNTKPYTWKPHFLHGHTKHVKSWASPNLSQFYVCVHIRKMFCPMVIKLMHCYFIFEFNLLSKKTSKRTTFLHLINQPKYQAMSYRHCSVNPGYLNNKGNDLFCCLKLIFGVLNL